MYRTFFLQRVSLCILFSLIAQVGYAQEAAPTAWMNNFEKASKLSLKTDRPILMHVHAAWCLPCQRMEKEVLNTPSVLQKLSANTGVIAVKVDAQQRQDLVQKFGVQLLPSDVFIDPKGRVLTIVTGFRSEADYTKLISQVEARYSQSQKIRKSRQIAKNNIPPKAKNQKVMKVSQVKKQIIAIDGYSPIAIRMERKWVEGKAKYESIYKGLTFRFASEEEKTSFDAEPAKYAPRLLGCDPVAMWELDRAIIGKTEYGAFFDGELYLFTSAENRKLFKIDPVRYTQTRHVLKKDEIELQTVIR